MRKCTQIVQYTTTPYYDVYELNCILNGGKIITLATYDEIDAKHPYPYKDFYEFYTMILSWLKNNNLTPYKWNEFGCDFYNIIWIDVNNPNYTRQNMIYREGVKI